MVHKERKRERNVTNKRKVIKNSLSFLYSQVRKLKRNKKLFIRLREIYKKTKSKLTKLAKLLPLKLAPLKCQFY